MTHIFSSINLEILYGYVLGLGFICNVPDKTNPQAQRKVETYTSGPVSPVQPAPTGSQSTK